ncbi:MAG: sensor protein [bacterium]|nr:sensor protein [bacterium]
MSPWFEPEDAGLRDFWLVYDLHYAEILEATMRLARAHREFAPIVAALSPADGATQTRESRERLRRAVVAADWDAYEEALRAQGQVYARMGISFAGWYDLVGDFQGQMISLLVRTYDRQPERLAASLKAMQSFVDRTMMLIGDEYLKTKETLLFEQRALAETHQERYRMLFDNGPVPMWVYDRQTLTFLAVNRAAVDLYGYSEDEFLAMTIEDIRFAEDLPRLRAENERLKSERGRLELGEWRHRTKDGRAIFVDLKLQSFIYLGHRAHLVVAADVTERKDAARAIAESEERYRSLVAATSSVVWSADGAGRFVSPQPSWEAHTGQSRAEYEGLGWLDAILAEDRAPIAAAWQLACAAKTVFTAEGRLWHAPTGRHRWFVARAVPLGSDGVVREWIGTISDVEEQKQAEQPGRFFTLSLDMLCVAGIDGYFKRLNPSFSILGYSEQELLSRPFLDFVHPDDLPATLAEVGKLARGEKTVHFENRYRCKDGSYRDLLWASAADPSGLIYAAARDITERKRTEEDRAQLNRRLVEQNEELTRASRAKSDFLAMMSHELRTPLNSIIGFSEVLSDQKFGGLTEKQARYVQNVLQSGRHLLGLINDLLDLSKIEAGRLEMLREPCAPLTLAAEAIATLQPLAEARKIEVTLERGTATPPPITADAARFKQILYNLLSNAIKFTAAGGRVRVECALTDDGRFVRVSVRDSGSGIAREDLPRLFTPFTQLGNAKGQGGTGLGLSLTRQLVELMGGRIGVDSELGVGATFSVDLPVHTAPAQAARRPSERRADSPLILVVDDEATARELLVLALQEAGFRTLAVGTGDEAIAKARLHRPAAITLDILLPTIDGWDVMRLLKSDPATADIPVVIVSISSDRAKAFTLGAHEHLVKPVSREALLAAVARRGFIAKVKTAPVHVLAIDDDLEQLELIRAALEPHGFAVHTETSGRAGIRAALSQPVDLVLLDLVMPDVSGIEVVSALRADARTRALPILLITAHELTQSQRARLNGDVAAIVSKSAMRMQDLPGEVTRILRDDAR